MNIGTKINLSALVHKVQEVKGKSGMVKCIIIPIDLNGLYHSEQNNVFLDLIGFEIKDKKDKKETHIVKRSLSREQAEKLTDEEKNALPILGKHTILVPRETNNEVKENFEVSAFNDSLDDDDLPF